MLYTLSKFQNGIGLSFNGLVFLPKNNVILSTNVVPHAPELLRAVAPIGPDFIVTYNLSIETPVKVFPFQYLLYVLTPLPNSRIHPAFGTDPLDPIVIVVASLNNGVSIIYIYHR